MTVGRSPVTFQVREVAGGLVVDLTSPRRFLTALIVAAWLVGWAIGVAFLLQQLRGGEAMGPDRWFLYGWSVAWLAAGGFAAGYLAWLVAGRERVTLDGERLRIWRGVGRLGVTHDFPLGAIHELRTFGRDVVPLLAVGLDFAGAGASGVRFRFDGRVVRFARALEEPEAHALVDRLRAAYPFPRGSDARVEPAA